MLKQACLHFLLIVVITSIAACSSNQDAIEQAVQKTVEAQQASTQPIDRQTGNQTDQNENSDAVQQEDIQQVDQEAADRTDQNENNEGEDSSTSAAEENQPSLADSILGVWSGTPGLTVPGDSSDPYESFTFYEDIVVFQGENGPGIAFIYDIVDSDTLSLMDIVGEPVGTLQITQESPDSLNLTLIYSSEPDNSYESSELKKTADVEITDVPSIEEAILGSWHSDSYGESSLYEFFAGFFIPDGPWKQYEFREPNHLILYWPYSTDPDDRLLFEIIMPNEDTLLWWVIEANGESSNEFIGVLNRESRPSPVIERPENEVLYPFYVSPMECGYIDRNGNIVIKPTFAKCWDFYEGLAAVDPFSDSGEDLLGYIDNSGQFVINPQFNEVLPFNEGVALVRGGSTFDRGEESYWYYGYIDQTGRYVIPRQYDKANSFSDGLAYVEIPESEWSGYIDKTGNAVFESDPGINGAFHDGLLSTNNGYLDKTGKIAIDIRGSDFSEGLAAIRSRDDDGCYYINTKGKVAIQTDFSDCEEFSEGLAAVSDFDTNTCGYIDKDGNLVIDLRFDQCLYFSEDRARVTVGDYVGYIDKQGEYILDPYDFGYAGPFHEGLARVAMIEALDAWAYGYIDRDGNYVLEP